MQIPENYIDILFGCTYLSGEYNYEEALAEIPAEILNDKSLAKSFIENAIATDD